MTYNLGFIGPIAQGNHGENVFAIIHNVEGEILQQMTNKVIPNSPNRLLRFGVPGYNNIYEVVDDIGTSHGYIIAEECSKAELERFLDAEQANGYKMAFELEGLYLQPLSVLSVMESDLYPVIQLWFYDKD